MKNSMKDSFRAACEDYRMNFTKGKLMNLAYGKNYSGIDSAIPQFWVNENPNENLFYFVTDCSTSFFEVKNLLDMISDPLAEKVIRMRELFEFLDNKIKNHEEFRGTSEFMEYEELHDEFYKLLN